ncbi:hypothetical protein OAK35_00450 [Crocinitomicaceae bacterium]|nr:hypothetical protein [Crocinitomicaceae bacterium]
MKNEFENSDKRLQEKLEGFRMAAPEGAWAGIEGNIGGKAGGRGKFFYVWIALLFIGVTGAGILTYLYVNSEDKNAAKISSVALNSTSETDSIELTTSAKKASNSNTSTPTDNSQKGLSNSATNTSSNTSSPNARLTTDISASNEQNETNGVTQVQESGIQSGSSSNSSSSASKSAQSNSNSGSQSQNAASNTASNSGVNNSTNSETNQTTNTSSNETASTTTNSGNTEGKTWNASNENNTSKTNTEESNGLDGSNSDTSRNASRNDSLAQSNNNSMNSTETNTAENTSNEQDSLGTLATVPNPTTSDIIEVIGSDPLNPDVKVKPIWSLEGGLDVSAYNFNHSVANNVNLEQSLNASYSQNFAQAAFLRVNYQPFQRFSFHSGMEYAQNKVTQDYSWLTTSTSFQYDTTGWIFDSITQQQVPVIDTIVTTSQVENQTQFKSAVNQINIPLGVMFHIPLGGKSELGINATGVIGIRSGSTGEILVDQNGNSIAVTGAYKSVNFSARTALRYSYFIGGKSTIYVEPYVGFGLNDRSNSSLPFTTRFRNSGIRVGFRYNF